MLTYIPVLFLFSFKKWFGLGLKIGLGWVLGLGLGFRFGIGNLIGGAAGAHISMTLYAYTSAVASRLWSEGVGI